MGTKEDYIARLKAQIDIWNAELETLKAKARLARLETSVEYRQQIESLQRQLNDLKASKAELQQASESSWEDLKSGAEQAWKSFREGLERARSRFK